MNTLLGGKIAEPMTETLPSRLYEIAQAIASETPDFFEVKGPGPGNQATNAFMNELRERATAEFGEDFSEDRICGENAFAVDYYFPEDATIVEIALGLLKPNTEYEKDVLKAIMAKEFGHAVEKLVFISKPGAQSKCAQPGRVAIKEWLVRHHGIVIEVHELRDA